MKSAQQIIKDFDGLMNAEEAVDDYEDKISFLLGEAVAVLREMVTQPMSEPAPMQEAVEAAPGAIAAFSGPQTEAEIMKPVNFKDGCFGMRADIELVKSKCWNWLSHPEFNVENTSVDNVAQHGEMWDNIKLAYRHLEDARMRIGKAVQAYDGGKSCYPQ